jgi:hypothetical protein
MQDLIRVAARDVSLVNADRQEDGIWPIGIEKCLQPGSSFLFRFDA